MYKTFYKPKTDSSPCSVVWFLVHFFRIRATKTTINELLDNHVEYPSLLAVKDTLYEYGIESAAIRKGYHSYADFETPFICAIQQEDWVQPNFTIITDVNNDVVTYLDPLSHRFMVVSITEFEQLDKGTILLLDGTTGKDEANYVTNKRKEQAAKCFRRLPILLFILSLLFSLSYLLTVPAVSWINIFFLFSSAIGLGISLLLLWHEVDAHNPFIREVCSGFGKKASCGAVLSSPGAVFLGVSWSVWGFSYFATFLLSQILFGNQLAYGSSLWPIASVLTAPYIIYSLYYQGKVIKQWCPLCLGIQGILFLNAVASFVFLSISSSLLSIDAYAVYTVVAIWVSCLLLTYLLYHWSNKLETAEIMRNDGRNCIFIRISSRRCWQRAIRLSLHLMV